MSTYGRKICGEICQKWQFYYQMEFRKKSNVGAKVEILHQKDSVENSGMTQKIYFSGVIQMSSQKRRD